MNSTASNSSNSVEHLSRPPVVEAVIEIAAAAGATWTPSAAQEQLFPRLDGYAKREMLNQAQITFSLGPLPAAEGSGNLPGSTGNANVGWTGVRVFSTDNKRVAIFSKAGLVVSRLAPYTSWEEVSSEALRLWEMFSDVAKPAVVERVSTRFINRLSVGTGPIDIADYFTRFNGAPNGWLIGHFLHQDFYACPERPSMSAAVIRTIQPPGSDGDPGIGLILDLSVSSNEPFVVDSAIIRDRLREMRERKNHLFASSITDKFRKACS